MSTPQGIPIFLATGQEVLTGSTRLKAGTATKLALNQISTTLMVLFGKVYQNLMIDLRASNSKLVDRAIRIITTLTGLNRGQAHQLLISSNDNVKTALVMHFQKVDYETAIRKLEESQGHLHPWISS